jgi:hypothetical protein
MAKKRNNKANKAKEKLKWETAKELGLDDDLAGGGDELTTREAGKIGGQMVSKMIKKGKEKIREETKG